MLGNSPTDLGNLGGALNDIAYAINHHVFDVNSSFSWGILTVVDGAFRLSPAASIVKVTELKKPAQASDQILLLADISAKARVQVTAHCRPDISECHHQQSVIRTSCECMPSRVMQVGAEFSPFELLYLRFGN
jgi:hypothetical protein